MYNEKKKLNIYEKNSKVDLNESENVRARIRNI